MMLYEKNDEIDVAAIGDLLKRGEGSPFNPPEGVYLQLQHLARVRTSKVKMRTMLRNQIIGHLDRIFPGLVIIGKEAKKRCKPMFATDFWECQTMQHLIRVCSNPHQLTAMSTQVLIDAFHAHGHAMGPVRATKIITYAQKVLLPDPELVAVRCQLLPHDLALLEEVKLHIGNTTKGGRRGCGPKPSFPVPPCRRSTRMSIDIRGRGNVTDGPTSARQEQFRKVF